MSETCVITALFDISRDMFDGRSIDQYLKWFAKTMELPVAMVIYTESKFEQFIISARENLPTKINYTTLLQVQNSKH